MARKPWLTDEEREARKRARILLKMADLRGIYGGVGQGSKARAETIDEGEEIMPLVQRGDNRLLTNLGEGARWLRARYLR
jgi:hypothetical protein